MPDQQLTIGHAALNQPVLKWPAPGIKIKQLPVLYKVNNGQSYFAGINLKA